MENCKTATVVGLVYRSFAGQLLWNLQKRKIGYMYILWREGYRVLDFRL
jgi:hypothetical protein